MKDGLQDNNKQISDIESLIQKKCDLIIVSPNEAKPLTDIVEKVYNFGIPIIILDRKVEGESYSQFIGADNFAIGKKAGEWVINYLGDKGGNVVEILGSIGSSSQIDRHKGFLKAISKNPRVKVIDSGCSNWLREKAIAVMEKMLRDNIKIDVVFAHNDPSAEGAITAAKVAGREKNIKFISVDGLPNPGIRSVMDGRISVTYLYPTGAREAIESAYKLLVKKETLVKNLKLESAEITKKHFLTFK
jgi:ribose transport system substrate-binding protein